MAVSDDVRRAVEGCFTPQDREAVLAALAEIVNPANATEEYAQSAALALGYGERVKVVELAGWARGDARDVLYWLESPKLYQPGLTRGELVRRYRALGLPVPAVLAGKA